MTTSEKEQNPRKRTTGTPESMPAGHRPGRVPLAPFAFGSGGLLAAAAVAQAAAVAGPTAALIAGGSSVAAVGAGWVIYRRTKAARENRTGQKKERRWYLQLNKQRKSAGRTDRKGGGSAGRSTGSGRGSSALGGAPKGRGKEGKGRGLTSRLPLIGDRRGRRQAAAGHPAPGGKRDGRRSPLAAHGPTKGKQKQGRLLRGPSALRRSRRPEDKTAPQGRPTGRSPKQPKNAKQENGGRLPKFLAGLKPKGKKNDPSDRKPRNSKEQPNKSKKRRDKKVPTREKVCGGTSGRLAKLAGSGKPLVFSRRKPKDKDVAGKPDQRPGNKQERNRNRPQQPSGPAQPGESRVNRNRQRNRNRNRGRGDSGQQSQVKVQTGNSNKPTVDKWLEAERANTTPVKAPARPERNAKPRGSGKAKATFGHPAPSGTKPPTRKAWAHLDGTRTAKQKKHDRINVVVPATGGSSMSVFDNFSFEDASPDEVKSKLHQLPDELGVSAHKYASVAQQLDGTAYENGLRDLMQSLAQVHLAASNKAQEAPAAFESSNATAFQFREEYGGRPGAVNWAER